MNETHKKFKLLKRPKEEAKKNFKVAIAKLFVGAFIVLLLVVCFHYFYLGALWDPIRYVYRLDVGIVNNDKGITLPNGQTLRISDQFVSAILSVKSVSPDSADQSLFDWKHLQIDSLDKTIERVDDTQQEWAVFYIPETFTANLLASINSARQPNMTDKYSNTIKLIFDEGRQQNTVLLVRRIIAPVINKISNSFSQKILAGALGPLNTTVANLEAVTDPIQTEDINIHPVPKNGHGFASYLGAVLLWIGSLFCVSIIQSSTLFAEGSYSSKFLIGFKVAVGIFLSFLISISQMLILITLGTDFEKGPIAYWAFTFYVCLAFISVIAFLINGLGPIGLSLSTFFLILQISSTNAVYSNILTNEFFKVGYGLPMFYAIEGVRYILFGSVAKIGRDVGILTIYIVVFGLANMWIGYVRTRQRISASTNQTKASHRVSGDVEMADKDEKEDKHEEGQNNEKPFDENSSPIDNIGYASYGVPAAEVADAVVDKIMSLNK